MRETSLRFPAHPQTAETGTACRCYAPSVLSDRPRVYLETSVISYLTARPSRNLRVVAHQEIAADWWTRRRLRFNLYVSRLVIDEASAGDAEAAAQRLVTLAHPKSYWRTDHGRAE